MIYGVILAGGRGERFWPLSRQDNPKQLLKLTSSKTMILETVERLNGFIPREQILVVTGQHLREKILTAVPGLTDDNLLLEPEGRNTCLAIGWAAAYLKHKDPDATMVILSSDHLVHPTEKLISLLRAGAEQSAREKNLITIGVVPTRAETAYGYIELGEKVVNSSGIDFYHVKQFKEKPNPTKAQEYYLDRCHLWNSGIFVWRADTILESIERFVPGVYECIKLYVKSLGKSDEKSAREKLYCDSISISIDFAVLENAPNVLTMKGEIKWDDVGSWLALDRIRERDRFNNVAVGDVLLDNSYENTVVNDDAGIIVGLGVSDLVIVRAGEIVMVAHKTRVGELKELLAKLGADTRYEKYL
ncbi:MAG TPA: mannose-1-phosphate guanylyltransferase [candidate division Zixibacteria bacterium]|nr:mannose-1-phosphate guanylyltransferase [candidate division Zixibacteria bacterium]HBZ00746.1 mannose-1-phosphate guanylyltransferase [candidate division Zixibacteria bacterium]